MSRPRSARAHRQVLDAALELFAARGIDATSMDAIAEASGVSKATIYKHWPDKEALCLEAMAYLHGGDQPRPVFDSGDVRADLIAVLSFQPRRRCSKLRLRLMPHLMAYAARNPTFSKAWGSRLFEPSSAQLTQLLEHAIAQGQLPRSLDLALALGLLLGPMTYFQVLTRLKIAVPENLPEQVVASFWKAHAIAPRASSTAATPPRASPTAGRPRC